MAWASTQNDKVIAVSYNKDQLPTGDDITVDEFDDDVCYKILSGEKTLTQLNTNTLDVEAVLNDSAVNIKNKLTGYGEFIHIPHWEYHLFGQISNKNLLDNRHFFIWDWRHRFGHEIVDAFPWDEFNAVRAAHPGDRISVILDNSMEAPDYHNHLKPLCDQLIAENILPKDILFWACIEEPDIPVSSIDTRNGYVIGMRKIPQPDYETTHHFIMLARNPRPLRLLMANEILNRQLETYGQISCGSGQVDYDYYSTPYIDDMYRHIFPLMLDGSVHYTDKRQYSVDDPRILKAAINVICETSQDAILDGVTLWIKPFITEKTSKAFFLCQFPLMASVPGMVDKLRRHGFDMFDDIIDHSYDTELDPYQRINLIGEQLEKLCNIENIAELRQLHWNRLIANRQTLLNIFSALNSNNVAQLEKWLEDTNE